MNYGKEGAKKKARDLNARTPKVLRKFKIWIDKLLLVAAFAGAVLSVPESRDC